MTTESTLAQAAGAPEQAAGIGLALSGGGFRATLFHLGSLIRLNELGHLGRLSEITSVSGGSIAAGLLGLRWSRLGFDGEGHAAHLQREVVEPLRRFCSRTVDIGAILKGWLNPFTSPVELLRDVYDARLFDGATLQDLPKPSEGPRFTLYATNLQTGVSVRFSQPYMAEYRLGEVRTPAIPLATAVAASSAFPPLLVPLALRLEAGQWSRFEGADLYDHVNLRTTMLLGDGGIYDNMGLERVWNRYPTVLVSDAGAKLKLEERGRCLRRSQVARTMRTLDITIEQSRALRKRKLVDDFVRGVRGGAYWGIATEIDHYGLETAGLPPPIVHDDAITRSMAGIRTRLNRFTDEEQGRLINWGYALTDAAMRRHVLGRDAVPGKLPVPEHPL
ncbi:MAG: patatin-like phospholipase family protein [Alphaproteobacteria bacterium]